MKGFRAFFKKELLEQMRSYRLLIILAVFLLFGMLNPLTAKLLPDIMKQVMPDGMHITLPDSAPLDSWTQFYKNMTGVQLILFVILFSNTLSGELQKGTLLPLFTKGLKRSSVLLAKYASMILVWTVAYGLSYLLTLGYTLYLLPGEVPHLFFAGVMMWLYGVLLFSILLTGSIVTSSIYGALLSVGGAALLLMLTSIFQKVYELSPQMLSGGPMSLLQGSLAPSDFMGPALITLFLILFLMACNLKLFQRKKI